MEMFGVLLIVALLLFVVWKLGLFNPIVNLSNVATRESAAYDREHKVRVRKRYEGLEVGIESVEKVNETIALVDAIDFD